MACGPWESSITRRGFLHAGWHGGGIVIKMGGHTCYIDSHVCVCVIVYPSLIRSSFKIKVHGEKSDNRNI